MKYNLIPRTGTKVSQLGLGGEHVGPMDLQVIQSTVNAAMEGGVNLVELFMPQPDIRDKMSAAIRPFRKDLLLMGHIGSTLTDDGQYLRSRDPVRCERFVDDFLTRYHTDTIDFGMLHYIDTDEDFRKSFETPFLDYALRLKQSGKIRYIGASSHNAATAIRMVKTGLVDVLLFSLNPAQDILPEVDNNDYFVDATYANLTQQRLNPTRRRLYDLCAEQGVGILVMKAMGCGRMLTSQNGLSRPLTPLQCIHYAATRPGVASVVVGCTSPKQVAEMLSYENAPAEALSFADVMEGMTTPEPGKCMYCNHCLPCPRQLDIGSITHALDMHDLEALKALAPAPSACIRCGLCEPNCPFGVDIRGNMAKAAQLLG